jgi:PAS domain S-box-containing protein
MSQGTPAALVDPGLLSQLLDTVPIMLWMTAPDMRCTFVNKALLDFVGQSREQQLDNGWLTAVHPDDVDRCMRACVRPVISQPPCSEEYRLRHADGEYRWVLAVGVAQFDLHGTFLGFVGSCIDITERKQIEAALRESEIRFRQLAENAPDVVYRRSFFPSPHTEYINRASTLIAGRTPEEFYANPHMALEALHPDSRTLFRKAIDNPESFREPVVLRWLHRDGRVVWSEHRSVPVRDAAGRLVGIEGIGRDITDRLVTQERARVSEAQLRSLAARLQSAREEERSAVSRELHDQLGQALTGLKYELVMTIKALSAAGLTPTLIDRVQALVGVVEETTNSVRRIATELRPPALDLLGLGTAIKLEAAAIRRRTGLRCRVTSSRKTTHLDHAQRTTVFRVFQEALTNIVRHANASAAQVRLREVARTFVMEIQDNGRGITQRELTDPGSIGLLGMRERVQLIGGQLEIEGRPGKGTRIVVRFTLRAREARATGRRVRGQPE